MLRLIALLLVLANGVYFAWTAGSFAAWGFAPAEQREPQRVTEQVKPERVKIQLPMHRTIAGASGAASGPASALHGQCMQSELLDATQTTAVRNALAAALPSRWRLTSESVTGRWMIYMGKYPDLDVLQRKEGELRRMKISFVVLKGQQWGPALSLGVFDDAAKAEENLRQLGTMGVHTARVIQERAPMTGYRLKLPLGDTGLQDQLSTALPEKSLRGC